MFRPLQIKNYFDLALTQGTAHPSFCAVIHFPRVFFPIVYAKNILWAFANSALPLTKSFSIISLHLNLDSAASSGAPIVIAAAYKERTFLGV